MSYKAPAVRDGVEFRIYSTEKLKATKADDGKMRIRGIASSTVRDHHGDLMERSALQDMILAAADNMTIFLNHDYKAPEDIFGSVEKAVIKRVNEGTEHADFYHTLILDIVVDENNERAVKTWKHIENGTKLGLSIGAMIPSDGWSFDEEKDLYIIHHVVLLETSVVTIPANPKSWITNAIKAIKSFEGVEMEEEDEEEARVLHLDAGDMVELNLFADSKKEGTTLLVNEDVAAEETTAEVVTEKELEPVVGENAEIAEQESVEPELTDDTEPDITDNAEEEIDEGDSLEVTESAEPTSQEAPEAAPENEDGAADAAEEVTAGLEDEGPDLSSLAGIIDNLKALTAQAAESASLEETVKALEAEKRARAEQQQLIDDLMKVSGQMLAGLKQATDLLGQMPRGRKTHFVSEVKDVTDGLEGVFNEKAMSIYQAIAAKKE